VYVTPAPQRVLVPPRLDLSQYGQVGLTRFTVERVKGQLDEFATRRFSEDLLSAQPGIEVLELGSADSIRRRVGEADYGPATVVALGAARGVPAVFVGHLRLTNPKPSGGLRGLTSAHVEANVTAELTVALVSTRSGGTLWRASGVANERVGGLSLVGGEPFFSAKNPDNAYGRMVNNLIAYVTQDLRPTWETR
jgi:hypothetical protein